MDKLKAIETFVTVAQRGSLTAAAKAEGVAPAIIGRRLDALAVFQKGAALVREADAPRGAHQQLHAQVLFQGIQPPPHDGGRHAFGLGRSGETAARGH